MRYFLLFFYLLFGQIAHIQANYSVPQATNYQVVANFSNPIEPIKIKKGLKYKKNPIFIKTQKSDQLISALTVILATIFIIGTVLFSIGFLQSIALLFWLGLGLEFLWAAGLISGFIYAFSIDNWGSILPLIIILFAVPISFFIKGLLLLILGLIASVLATWITGIAMFLLGIALLILIIYLIDKH